MVVAFIVRVQVPRPEQPPPFQPVNVDPTAGFAVSVTTAPEPKVAEHVDPQLMPAGVEVTTPLPAPALPTPRVNVCWVKVALTAVAAFMVTLQLLVPEHPPPLQPANAEPPAGLAESVTKVPEP